MVETDKARLDRRAALMGALAAFGFAAATPAGAQPGYPSGPVRILVGFPAGSSTDIAARVLATKLSERLGQPVIVENRPGAAGVVATGALIRSAPDGLTLLMGTTADTVSPSLNSAVNYDIVKDTAPIAMVAEIPFVLLVHSSNPARNVQELVANASKKPAGEILFGSSGTGTLNHLFGELFSINTGVKLTHVPYRSSSAAIPDLMTGRISMFFSTASAVIEHIKSGQLKALATIGRQRFAMLPDVPTFGEAGISGIDTPLWFGLMAPAGTPEAIVNRLNRETVQILSLPDVQSQLKAQGAEPTPGSREQLSTAIVDGLARWARVVKLAGLTKK